MSMLSQNSQNDWIRFKNRIQSVLKYESGKIYRLDAIEFKSCYFTLHLRDEEDMRCIKNVKFKKGAASLWDEIVFALSEYLQVDWPGDSCFPTLTRDLDGNEVYIFYRADEEGMICIPYTEVEIPWEN